MCTSLNFPNPVNIVCKNEIIKKQTNMAEQIKKLYFSLQLRRHKTRPLAYLIPLLCTYLTVCERRISTVLPHRRERQQDRPTIHPTINFVRNSTFPQLTPNALVLSGCNPPSPSPSLPLLPFLRSVKNATDVLPR